MAVTGKGVAHIAALILDGQSVSPAQMRRVAASALRQAAHETTLKDVRAWMKEARQATSRDEWRHLLLLLAGLLKGR